MPRSDRCRPRDTARRRSSAPRTAPPPGAPTRRAACRGNASAATNRSSSAVSLAAMAPNPAASSNSANSAASDADSDSWARTCPAMTTAASAATTATRLKISELGMVSLPSTAPEPALHTFYHRGRPASTTDFPTHPHAQDRSRLLPSARAGYAYLQLAEVAHFVAQNGRPLELQIGRRGAHLLLQRGDAVVEIRLRPEGRAGRLRDGNRGVVALGTRSTARRRCPC